MKTSYTGFILSYIAKETVDELKGTFAPVDSDIKDAKRRISVAKGPKKKKTPAPKAEVQAEASSDPEESDDEDDDQ